MKISRSSLSVLLILVIGEILLRGIGFHYLLEIQPIEIWNPQFDKEIKSGSSMFRFHPTFFWEMRPESLCLMYPDEKINKDGFRGISYNRGSAKNALRIVCLGDSSTFGMGVPLESTYSFLLRKKLQLLVSDKAVEVINAGVIGYSSFQGYQILKHKIMLYQPEIVILYFGAINEQFPANPYSDREKIKITATQNQLLNEVSRYLLKVRIIQLVAKMSSVAYLRFSDRHHIDKASYANYEKWHNGKEYKQRVSLEEFRDDLEGMIALTKKDWIHCLLVSPHRRKIVEEQYPILPLYTQVIESVSEKNNIPLVDIHNKFFSNYGGEEKLFLPGDHFHPNVIGHELIAQELSVFIFDNIYKKRHNSNSLPFRNCKTASGRPIRSK